MTTCMATELTYLYQVAGCGIAGVFAGLDVFFFHCANIKRKKKRYVYKLDSSISFCRHVWLECSGFGGKCRICCHLKQP